MQNKHITQPWKKGADRLGLLRPAEGHGDEFSEFSFCLIHPRQGAGEARNPETPKSTKSKSPNKNPALSSQNLEMGSPARQKTFYQQLI